VRHARKLRRVQTTNWTEMKSQFSSVASTWVYKANKLAVQFISFQFISRHYQRVQFRLVYFCRFVDAFTRGYNVIRIALTSSVSQNRTPSRSVVFGGAFLSPERPKFKAELPPKTENGEGVIEKGEQGPSHQLEGRGEPRELPQRGSGQSPDPNVFCIH